MTENTEKLEQLNEIRSMMERSSRFISLSGLSGVFAGFFAIAGAYAFHLFLHNKLHTVYADVAQEIPVTVDLDFIQFCLLDGAAILILSIASAIFFTTRKAKKTGQSIWDKTARRMLLNLAIPLISGGFYCLVLLKYRWVGLIAPTTLIFYGLALVNASKYTLDEIRWLGISEIALGLISCLFIGYGVTFWVIGFGVLHIVYGLMMYVRYETTPKPNKYW